MDNLINCYVMG